MVFKILFKHLLWDVVTGKDSTDSDFAFRKYKSN